MNKKLIKAIIFDDIFPLIIALSCTFLLIFGIIFGVHYIADQIQKQNLFFEIFLLIVSFPFLILASIVEMFFLPLVFNPAYNETMLMAYYGDYEISGFILTFSLVCFLLCKLFIWFKREFVIYIEKKKKEINYAK